MSTRLINRTERLTEIEQMLFHHPMGLRAVEIAEACGVDRRTIYRDLALLVDIGLPVFQKDGRFLMNREYYGASVRLNTHESVALFIAAHGMAHYARQQNPHMISALKKLSLALPEPIARHVLFLIEAIRTDAVDRAFVSVLELFTRAWAERRKVKLWYRGGDELQTRVHEFAPYFIEMTGAGSLYAVGYDYQIQQVRAFKLQLVKRVQMLGGTFDIPGQFERQRYLVGIPGMMDGDPAAEGIEVVLLFAPEVTSHVIERMGHSLRQVSITEDERALLRFQVADWRELLPWIRSWGDKVEVLEPNALREEVVLEANRVAAVYAARMQS